jgi:hypothetical protein
MSPIGYLSGRIRPPQLKDTKRKCADCGKLFTPKKNKQRYCNHKCALHAHECGNLP